MLLKLRPSSIGFRLVCLIELNVQIVNDVVEKVTMRKVIREHFS
jgi:hypothetical protein